MSKRIEIDYSLFEDASRFPIEELEIKIRDMLLNMKLELKKLNKVYSSQKLYRMK